jgi:2-polyprenyl-6-methoxyphenol hydroxylase-like FAD-dependent oxidoreductase
MSNVIVVGAGPAGASLACLLASSGINTTLIERRQDFSREFRGEVLMPSGMAALEEMGLKDLVDTIPSYRQEDVSLYMNGRLLFEERLDEAIFQGRPPLAISQPALLEALVTEAARHPGFSFRRGVSVRELTSSHGRVNGVVLRTQSGSETLPADLVIGADGRNSIVRRHLNLETVHASPPMDIVWCKLPCPANWRGVRAYLGRGHLLVAYYTWDDSLQLGWVIVKGTFGELKARGIEQWITEMANHVSDDLAQHLHSHANAAEKPFLLDAVSDRVTTWSVPGALLIGDAAHTMSPVAGQGVNIALRDTIVAANHLLPVLHADTVDADTLDRALRAIEAERLPEVETIQRMQDQPPKIVLSKAWWGEPVRRLIGRALSQPAIRGRLLSRITAFPFGVTDVKLHTASK